jgi:DNA-binding transcriptional MocR family regulator
MLAVQLDVSRGVVVEAYNQLIAAGWASAPASRRSAGGQPMSMANLEAAGISSDSDGQVHGQGQRLDARKAYAASSDSAERTAQSGHRQFV